MTKLALNRPVSAILLIIAVTVFGIISIFNLKLEMLPSLEVPMLVVTYVYPGAPADIVEKDVVEKVEDACMGLNDLDSYTAYSYENYCTIVIAYQYGVDIDKSYMDLTKALNNIDLPDDVEDPEIIEMGLDSKTDATFSFAIQSSDINTLNTLALDEIIPELESISGVAKVDVSGGSKNYVKIELDPQALDTYGLNIRDVANFVGSTDFNLPLGEFDKGNKELPISASEKLTSLVSLRNIPLMTDKSKVVTLEDIATIRIAGEEKESISRFKGIESMTIEVDKAQSVNTVSVTENVMKVINEFAAKNPDVAFHIINNTGDNTFDILLSIMTTLIIGAFLAMIIIFFFFGDFKASFIIGSSIPLSLLLSLCVMNLFGFTMHLMTGSALVIAIGMIVDNSIVVLESCFRHQKVTKNPREAVINGTKSVLSSIIASTITTSVVYLPFGILSGLAGQFMSEFGFTIIIVMVSSLLSAVTVVPLFYTILKPKEKENLLVDRLLKKVTHLYKGLMPSLLKHKVITLFIAIIIFAGSIFIGRNLDFELLPTSYDGSITIEANYRPGSTLETMAQRAGLIEEMLLNDPHFDEVNMIISEHTASFTAYSIDDKARSSEDAVSFYVEELGKIPNMDITVLPAGGNSSSLGFLVQPYSTVSFQGYDIDQVTAYADTLQAELLQIPGVIKVNSDNNHLTSQARIKTNTLKAMSVGLTPAQVAMEIYYALNGIEVMTATLDDSDYMITLSYPDGVYPDENALLNKTIKNGFGTYTTIGDIAEIAYDDVLQSRVRMDGKYLSTLEIIPDAAHINEVTKEVNTYMNNTEFPKGISPVETTEDRIMYKELSTMALFVLSGVFLVFLLMAMQFESPRFSFMVMTSIPFSLIGSIIMMRLNGISINLISMLGILTLVGTVVNNGILFVDTTNKIKQEMPVKEALIESGVIRLRPILMTTLTTVIAMIPMSLAKGGNTGMMSGLATVIIGGLIVSTLLILLFLPNFYLLISGKKATTLGLKYDEKEQLESK